MLGLTAGRGCRREEGHYMRFTTGFGPVMKLIGISMLIGLGLGLYLGAHVAGM